MSPWIFNVYIDTVMELKMGMGVRFQEEGREWRMPGLISFYGASRRKNYGQWHYVLLRCVGKEV